MFHKNLRYYRLREGLSMNELASMVGETQRSISQYESGGKKPSMDMIEKLAKALNIRVSDFLRRWDDGLEFKHGEFRKGSQLPKKQQDYIKASVEEYMNRFYSALDILGDEVLPSAPESHQLTLCSDPEKNALAMREHLRIANAGPVGNMVALLENKGFLIYFCDIDNDAFSGLNGQVNGRPYIVVNQKMTPERVRSTIAHELAHFIFIWPDDMEEKDAENMATAISGAFLFSAEDAKRELGICRTAVTKDMVMTCKEYGISMYLLVKRAKVCGIINDTVEKNFYIKANIKGWKKNEPVRIAKEEPTLFLQLVLRAVNENEITVQKGAELLKQPYTVVADQCFAVEG